MKTDDRTKSKEKILCLIFCAVIIACIVGYLFYKAAHTVDLNDYLTISYEGYEGYAKPVLTLDAEAIERDYGGKLHRPPEGMLVVSETKGVSDTVATFLDRYGDDIYADYIYDYDLKNGDSVSICGTDKTKYDSVFGCWVKSESFKTWAQGIESLDDADPFEGLVIETDGGNSQAVAEVNKYEMKEPFCDIEFELCPDMYLSNGDTVEVAIPESELEKLARKNDGYVPKKTTQEYTIEGLPALTEDNAESDRKAEAVRKQRLKEAEEKAAKEQAEKEYKERLRQSHYKSSGGSGSWSDSYSYDDEDNIDPDDPDYEEGDEDFDSFDDIDYYDEGFEGEY